MATRDKDQSRSFLDYTNRRNASDGNSQGFGVYHRPGVSYTGNLVLDRGSSSGRSRGPRTCLGESSQVTNPALGTTLAPKRLARQHQPDKINMNKDSNTLVKKSGTNSTSVSRLSKDATSLLKRRGTSTIMQSKQITLKATAQPLKDPAGLDNYAIKPKMLENARNSGILASKHVMRNKGTAQPPKDSPRLIKNGGTSSITASKHVMQKREKAQHPKITVGLVKNIRTSIIPSSIHSVQKKKTIHLPKDSASSIKKIETTARSPTLKQFIQKKEKNQPSKGSVGVVSRSGTSRTLPSRLVTQRKETTFVNQRQKQHLYKDHIVWEGFDDRIVPLGMSCLLCEGDLANEPEYGPDREGHNPAGNAVLSCGHVFHSQCLRLTIAEEKCRDPPCIICASILS
ncbi:hypothetical protein HRI_003427200 [Hibiscus trionum]|uniref:RING-type domain-containing protein n=1 Tax=Hibiscus trionum TaxID=183268 RepID=A0A9W7MEU9_HIBTR|nr:hypothetical protein HRI_003427200 [Hibiscus trionum]